ncbi:MAG: hypothetical protein INR64_01565 [Caulobacteraceae bacterium]|nr:hypothetical protein [Caulobacter sp.]
MIAAIAAAVALNGAAPSPALAALGLGALRWNEPADQIPRAMLVWEPDPDRYAPKTLLTPGSEALVTVGGCAFAARFMGMHGKLTHVELQLSRGDREACDRDMTTRITAALGSPRAPSGMRSTYAIHEPFWDGVGESASIIDWGPPIDGLAVSATASDDESVTVR